MVVEPTRVHFRHEEEQQIDSAGFRSSFIFYRLRIVANSMEYSVATETSTGAA